MERSVSLSKNNVSTLKNPEATSSLKPPDEHTKITVYLLFICILKEYEIIWSWLKQ